MPADPEELERVRQIVSQAARGAGFDRKTARELATAANEAMANVIRHGYAGEPGHWVNLTVAATGKEFVIEFRDEGKQVDPAALRPDPDKDPMQPGGLGLAWMNRIMDKVEFRRRPGGGMITRMEKRTGNGGDAREAEKDRNRP